MRKKFLIRLLEIIKTTDDKTKRTYALWQVLTFHIKALTTDELFSFIPLIWQIDHSNNKYSGIRHKIEAEITARQNTETIIKLIELLKNDNPHLRFFGADLLNYFEDNRVIYPLLNYLQKTDDNFLTKRQAICAIGKYKDERVKQFLEMEYELNRSNKDTFFRDNYLRVIKYIIDKMK